MSQYAGLNYAVAIAVVGYIVVASIGVNRGLSRTPRGVMKRLAEPGARYTVHVGSSASMGGIWNPAKPVSINGFIHGYGTGTYWLDDAGIVHLDWTPRGRPTVHLSGPAPRLRPRSTSRSATLAVLLLVLASGTVTFFVATGSANTRLSEAMLVSALVLVLLWFVALSGSVGRALRRLRRSG